MSVTKKIVISLIAVFTAVCVGLDVWWAYVYFNGDDLLIVSTYEVELQTLTDGTQEPLIEVQLFRNVDGSGLTAFEIKWNYIMDESRTAFYSQGTQFIGDDFSYSWTCDELLYTSRQYGSVHKTFHYYYSGRLMFNNLERYDYMSGNDYYDTLNDADAIDDDTFFRLTLKTGDTGDAEEDYSIYGMKFKGINELTFKDGDSYTIASQISANSSMLDSLAGYLVVEDNGYYDGVCFGCTRGYHWLLYLYDYNYFCVSLYESIKDLSAGTSHYLTIKFGDWFLYYECEDEENGKYSTTPLNTLTSNKVTEYAESYYSIKVSVYDSGLTSANQSLFKSVRGSTTFNMTGDYTDDTYFYGRTIIDVDETMFIFVHIVDNYYALKLKDDFIEFYSQYYDLVQLSINIDYDYLEELGIEVVGFTNDSGLDNFTIYYSNVVEINDYINSLSGGEL